MCILDWIVQLCATAVTLNQESSPLCSVYIWEAYITLLFHAMCFLAFCETPKGISSSPSGARLPPFPEQ